MERLYDTIAKSHLANDDEMLFLSGPRQVGKTTVSKNTEKLSSNFIYLNWDDEDHRNIILTGPAAIIAHADLNTLTESKPIIAFDEIHKRPDWKNFLKGFYDSYGKEIHIVVSGSARLDIYKHGGDSLMGRYFPYRMHPFSVGECLRTDMLNSDITEPVKIDDAEFMALYEYGGFPKPFIKRNKAFSRRWQLLRKQQLIQEDIRDVNVIHNLNQLEILMDLLKQNASKQITYSTLAKFIKVSVDTISRWFEVLEAFYYFLQVINDD